MPLRSRRFYSLDVLRGVAALAIVFWHWQHFHWVHGVPLVRPMERIFFLFYGGGWLAVYLFFTLSGFVFFWLYAKDVANRRVSARDFFVLRFSRLYPLYLATLLAAALGHFAFRRLSGTDFVYRFNDGYHFLLNLGMASSWGLEKGNSFNGPARTISVEAAL